MLNSVPIATRSLAVPNVLTQISSDLYQADLSSAARVSRNWHGMFVPVLYHKPELLRSPFSARAEFDGLLLLMRTLVDRAELSDEIRVLNLRLDRAEVEEGKLTFAQLANMVVSTCTRLECVALTGKSDRVDPCA